MKFARGLYRRFQAIVHELAKFGVVGAINTGVHFGLFAVLHQWWGLGPLTSNGIALAIAATSSYVMNRNWTFRHRARTGMRREYSLFFLLNGVGWVISEACVAVTAYGLGRTDPVADYAALVTGVALGMGFRFTTYRRWVFLPSEAEDAPAGERDRPSRPSRPPVAPSVTITARQGATRPGSEPSEEVARLGG